MEDRDYCVRKDFSSIRNKERIGVICDLIKTLWVNYRAYNIQIGLFYMTNLLEVEANKSFKEDSYDPFYWEEDKWYDFIQDLIEKSKKFPQNYISYETKDITDTMEYFAKYWLIYPDLRLKQFLNIFNDMFETRIREDALDSNFWKNLFNTEINNYNNRFKNAQKEGESNGN